MGFLQVQYLGIVLVSLRGLGRLVGAWGSPNTQAKFRLPRNQANCKEMSTLWRPQAHVVGVLAAGVCEMYFIMDQDLPKDSNMQMTVLSRALDIVQDQLAAAGRAMPHHLCISADNTTREHRNQFVLSWECKLVLENRFRSVTNQYLRVGHTHIDLDARFSVIASALGRQQVLQTPQACWAK